MVSGQFFLGLVMMCGGFYLLLSNVIVTSTFGMGSRLFGLTTAVFILNRAPTKALMGKTLFEAWYGRKPSVSFLRTFGCIGHVRKTKLILTKLEDRSI